ncbi:hypothetical protein ACFQX6_37940 [Streptosporangium lutulentum]
MRRHSEGLIILSGSPPAEGGGCRSRSTTWFAPPSRRSRTTFAWR